MEAAKVRKDDGVLSSGEKEKCRPGHKEYARRRWFAKEIDRIHDPGNIFPRSQVPDHQVFYSASCQSARE